MDNKLSIWQITIHSDFTKELIEEWEKKNFSYEEVKQWKQSLDDNFKVTGYDFYAWLRDEKEISVEKLADYNISNLIDEFNEKDWTKIHEGFGEMYYDSDETYQQVWEEKGLTYQDAQEWIQAGWEPEEFTAVAFWKSRGYTPETAKGKSYTRHWLEWNYPPEGVCQRKDDEGNNHEDYGKKREEIQGLNISQKNLTNSLLITNWPQLEEIDCSENQLTNLELNNLPALTELSCHWNQLTKLTITNCPNLKKIDCSENQLTNLNFLTNCWESLTNLDIGGNQLTGDLTPFSQLINCEQLYLSNNSFTGSLAPLQNLSKLKVLWITNTQINSGSKYLPESLEEFSCSNNNFTTLDLNHCKNLTKLNCSDNPLVTLLLFNGGEKITRLGLSANHLKDLAMFSQLVNLEELDLSDYSSTSSLEPLKNYQKLKKLNLKGNTNILPDWEYLHKIKEITFEDTEEDLENKEISEHRKELIPYQRIEKEKYRSVIYYDLVSWRKNQPAYQNLQQALFKVNPNLNINEILNQQDIFFNVRTGTFEGDTEALINFLQQHGLITEKDSQINLLKLLIDQLKCSRKDLMNRISQAYLNFPNEKELLHELIQAQFTFTELKEKSLPSIQQKRTCLELEMKILDKLGEEKAEQVQLILTNCENLIRTE